METPKSRLRRSIRDFFLDLKTLTPLNVKNSGLPSFPTRAVFEEYFQMHQSPSPQAFLHGGVLQGDLARLKDLYDQLDDQAIEDAWNEFLVSEIMFR